MKDNIPSGLKSKEEILRPLIRKIGYSYDNIKDVETGHTSDMLNIAEEAMEEYAKQFQPPSSVQVEDNKYAREIEAEELWDEFSENIGTDISDLDMFAGKDVMQRHQFIKAIQKVKQ